LACGERDVCSKLMPAAPSVHTIIRSFELKKNKLDQILASIVKDDSLCHTTDECMCQPAHLQVPVDHKFRRARRRHLDLGQHHPNKPRTMHHRPGASKLHWSCLRRVHVEGQVFRFSVVRTPIAVDLLASMSHRDIPVLVLNTCTGDRPSISLLVSL
jgi:hypothetical protein